MSLTPIPVVILISGTGSNMRRIAELAQQGQLPVIVKAVISDKADAKGLAIAHSMGITTDVLAAKGFANREAYDAALAERVRHYQPQLVLLAGFMRILSSHFVTSFKDRLLNIHPSLLPKHKGLHTHQRALDAGDTEHGATVHVVTEALDDGPLIMQAHVPVLPGDDASTLAHRVLKYEHQIYPEAVRLFATGRLVCRNSQLWLDNQELHTPLLVKAEA